MNCARHGSFRGGDDGENYAAVAQQRERICRVLIAERGLVERLLGKALCPDSHWDILLTIYLAELERRLFYQSCLAPDSPPAKAHRQSARLAKLGAVVRTLDPKDHRRVNITLSAETRQALDKIMDHLAARS